MTALPLTEDDCTDGNSVAVIGLGAAKVPAHVQMAEKQLCGFARIAELKPGESRTVTVRIPERSLCYWDPERELSTRPDGTKDKWVTAAGARTVYVGPASDDLPLSGTIVIG